MKRLILIFCFFSTSAMSQNHEGHWLFYDLKLNEKFLLNLTDPMRGHQRISIRAGGGLGARYFKSDDYGKYSNYKVIINRQDFQFADETGSPVYMTGQFNADFTELAGFFNDGGRFVASKQNVLNAFEVPSVYQVMYAEGAIGEEGDKYCQKARDRKRDIKYSLRLKCSDTGGIGGARSQFRVELGGREKQRGQGANWLVKPNTFLDYQECKEAMQKLLDEHRCWQEGE